MRYLRPMCTVTYYPTPSGYILTHNRDEAPTRSPNHISRAPTALSDTLLFPRDTKAGGAWIVTTHSGRTACLLNGAFSKHVHQPPYRRSRGLMLLDFFETENPNAFFTEYDLTGIEPFTFLLFETGRVTELRWDGEMRHLKNIAPDATSFWCSATLYPPEMQVTREQVFQNWRTHYKEDPEHLPAALLQLHQTGSVGDLENDFIMNRGNRVRTVSITQVIMSADTVVMQYEDLLEGHVDRQMINFNKNRVNS